MCGWTGEDITALSPQARVAKGMGFVPQTHNIFTSMTVEENLEMGAFLRRDDIQATMEQVYRPVPDPEAASAIRRRANCRAASASRSPSAGR